MCWYPIQLGQRITKEGVIIPPDLVPCGKCIQCLQAKRASWTHRIEQELIHAKSSHFITLTYDEKHLTKTEAGQGILVKKDLQDYFKRVRAYNPGIKYYAVGEYGDKTDRPHYHAIVFNSYPGLLVQKWSDSSGAIGNVKVVNTTAATIHYVTGYILSKYGELDPKTGISVDRFKPGQTKPFAIMSKRLGISYVDNAKDYHITNQTFNNPSGKGVISRYLKLKIFEDYECLRLNITEQERKGVQEKLKQQSAKQQFSARRYYKELVKLSKQKKQL